MNFHYFRVIKETSMAYPFSRLTTDGFWHRIPKPGYDPDIEYYVSSMERLQEMYFGARMDKAPVAGSESRDDRPTNGMALCRLCHWSSDEGLMSVGASYEVLVSRRIRMDQNMPGHMLTLVDRPIFHPAKEPLWPAQDNLEDS
jgi:predicted restriction endonuclease